MNDFLQGLRVAQAEKQQPLKIRKHRENSHDNSNNSRFHSYNNGFNLSTRNTRSHSIPPSRQNSKQMPVEELMKLTDSIEKLTSQIEKNVKSMERIAFIQEKMLEMLERQAMITGKIVDHLNIADFAQEKQPLCERQKQVQHATNATTESKKEYNQYRSSNAILKKATSRNVSNNNSGKPIIMNRKAVMDIIHSMREKGATFEQVAKHLSDLNQPTFSGRGEWHAQTIHRLCNLK